MTNVISMPSTALGRARSKRGGLLRRVVAALRHGRGANELRGLTDRDLRDIGLSRRDVATVEWPSRREPHLTLPAARP